MKHTVLQKFFLLLLLFSAVLIFAGCARGNTSHTERIIGDSLYYSSSDIEKAMEKAEAHFRKEFQGCTMTEISYNEDKSHAAASEWALNYGDEECIILYSTFLVDSSGGDGSFTPNSTYANWQWVLTRNDGGTWQLRTWGYG